MSRWTIGALTVAVLGIAAPTRAAPSATHSLCSSCHAAPAPRAHRSDAIPAHAGSATRCEACHAAQAITHVRAHRSLDCMSCHDPHENGTRFRFSRSRVQAVAAVQNGAEFDDETRLCVSCHFETGAFRGLGGGFLRHPVGITPSRHNGQVMAAGAELVSASPLEPAQRVRLPLMTVRAPEGGARAVIGCATCHSIHTSANPFQLRWSPAQETAACSSCHIGVADEPVFVTSAAH